MFATYTFHIHHIITYHLHRLERIVYVLMYQFHFTFQQTNNSYIHQWGGFVLPMGPLYADKQLKW